MSIINLFFVFFFGINALKLNLSSAAECECDDTNPIIVNNTGFNFLKSVSNHSYCQNTSCSWTINISQIAKEYVVNMTTNWNIRVAEGPTAINDSISIFACDSGYVFLDSTTPKIPPSGSSTSHIDPFSIYTQEDTICINLTTGNGKFIDLYVNVDFRNFSAHLVTVKPITLNESMPLLMLNNDDLKGNKGLPNTQTLFQVDATYEDLEFDVIGGITYGFGLNNDGIFYIYESSKLTNYIDYYKYEYPSNDQDMDQFKTYISKNRNLSVLFMTSSNLTDQHFYDRQMIFKIRDERTTNCVYNSPVIGAWRKGLNISNNIFYFDRNNWNYYLNISASPNGFCNFSILIPIEVAKLQMPFLGIHSLNYIGNTSVLVVKENNFPIFSINEQNFRFIETGVCSNLTTFIIPPNERLEFWMRFLFINYIPDVKFNTTIFNIFMLPNCQGVDQPWGTQQSTICVSCHAQFNITIVYIELYLNEFLYISNGTYTMTFSNISLTNQTLTLYGSQLDISFVSDYSETIDTIQNRILVTYIGDALPIGNPTSPTEYFWIIGLAAGIMLILLIVIVLFIYIRYKKKGKRFEQLFDLIKEMQLSTDELENFKDKSDKMLIPNGKLFINYNNIIGQGSTSTIYKGHLTGPSPLSVNTQLLETQKYSNCDIAVKVTRNFGSGEVELFYKEIQAMKTIGYHENVMCMLGWAMPGDTPCLVFDISQTDLLHYVRSFREMVEEIPYKNFLSILWQIARGMNFIASKALVHRDLATRNILLCNSNVAKISDFGLCCKCDETTFTYQANLKKKLPIKWLSIEALTYHLFSEKSDVWSFGILIYEVFTFGRIPYTTMNHDEVLTFLQEGKRLDRPENMAEEIYEICRRCWEERLENRPRFVEVEENFHEILERETESYGYLT